MQLNRSRPGIEKAIREQAWEFTNWLRKKSFVKDKVVVTLAGEPLVSADNGDTLAFACYMWPVSRQSRDQHWIFIGAGAPELVVLEHNWDPFDAMDQLLISIAHEFAHYRQWRQGRSPSEDDANYMARKWVDEYYASV